MSNKGALAEHAPRGTPSITSRSTSWKTIAFTAILSSCFSLLVERHLKLVNNSSSSRPATVHRCRPPLPNTFTQKPIQADEPNIQHALRSIDDLVRHAFSDNSIDGLAVAIVTPNEVIYEAGLGALKANETDPVKRGTVDRHSIFRIASGSKLFAVLETLILRERGALQWYCPYAYATFLHIKHFIIQGRPNHKLLP